ncbi:MAG: type II secretion system protein M [Gammaproteobacteria bacterium]|nr:type II secretion system protein M [Gammaproteobacteria bacterium]
MNSYLERFRSWWNALAPRERRILSVGGPLAAVIVLYFGVWQSLADTRVRRERALADARQLAQRLEQIGAEVEKSRRQGGAASAGRNLSLLAAVDQAGKSSQLGKAPSRIQPEGDKQVRVWLEDVSFDALVRWMQDLQARYGLRIESADIERESGPGLVDARLTLVRP